MGLFDEPITYLYTCSECGTSFEHTATMVEHAKMDDVCKECGGKLTFKAVDYNPHATSDMESNPKTLGSLAEKNSKEREKRGLSNSNPNKRYDKSVLKNPERYIMTGKK